MAAKVQLPPEIYESIVDNLHDDPHSLKRCSLVCRRFAYRGQRLLFRSVILDRPSKSFKGDIVSQFYPAEKFLDLLNRSPHICKMVLKLTISDRREMQYYHEQRSWIRRDRAVAKILPMLCSLEGLEIGGYKLGSRLDFHSWREELKTAILLKSQSLRRLSLTLVRDVPLLLLNDTPNLECLDLMDVRFNSGTFPTWRSPGKAQLKTFTIFSCIGDDWLALYPWLQSTSCGIDMTNLTEVYFMEPCIKGDQLHSISWLLRGCRDSLKHLYLSYPDTVVTPAFFNEDVMNLGSMPVLESLHLIGVVWGYWDLPPQSQGRNRLRWLTNNLSRIGSDTNLKELYIECLINDSGESQQPGFERAGWEDFVEVIGSLARTVANTVLKLNIDGSIDGHTKNVLKERMLPLIEKGIALIDHHPQ